MNKGIESVGKVCEKRGIKCDMRVKDDCDVLVGRKVERESVCGHEKVERLLLKVLRSSEEICRG